MREVGEMLGAWSSFYVMTGSSAAALTGLMFIVITLVSGDSKRSTSEVGISTFLTPTVVHFCCALFTSALMSVPFRSFVPLAIVLGLVGAGGSLYVARVAHRTSRLQSYRADVEDWVWNALLPFVAYATLVIGAMAMHASAARALYAPAAAVIVLIFVGIHNAWDVVTFRVTDNADTVPGPANEGTTDTSDS